MTPDQQKLYYNNMRDHFIRDTTLVDFNTNRKITIPAGTKVIKMCEGTSILRDRVYPYTDMDLYDPQIHERWQERVVESEDYIRKNVADITRYDEGVVSDE